MHACKECIRWSRRLVCHSVASPPPFRYVSFPKMQAFLFFHVKLKSHDRDFSLLLYFFFSFLSINFLTQFHWSNDDDENETLAYQYIINARSKVEVKYLTASSHRSLTNSKVVVVVQSPRLTGIPWSLERRNVSIEFLRSSCDLKMRKLESKESREGRKNWPANRRLAPFSIRLSIHVRTWIDSR